MLRKEKKNKQGFKVVESAALDGKEKSFSTRAWNLLKQIPPFPQPLLLPI
jgi:hypothetical protein